MGKKSRPPPEHLDIDQTPSIVRLGLVVSPYCPVCKQLLSLKAAKYLIGKNVLDIMDVSDVLNAGSYVLTEGGLVYRLMTPTFIIYCKSGGIIRTYPVEQKDVSDAFVTMVYKIYLNYKHKVDLCVRHGNS